MINELVKQSRVGSETFTVSAMAEDIQKVVKPLDGTLSLWTLEVTSDEVE